MSTEKFVHSSTKRLVENLSNLLAEDEAWQSMEPIADIDQAQWIISKLYVKFIMVTNSFTKLLNMTVNYHKRERFKPLVSDLLSRIVELKAELTKIMKTDYPYLDEVLMDLNVTRRAMEIEIPDYYRIERSFVVKEFLKYAEKIKDGLILRPIPKKPVPELALDLRKFYVEDAKLADIIEGEMEGKRIERQQNELQKKLKTFSSMTSTRVKRPQKLVDDESGAMKEIVEMMGCKREDVFRAMRTVAKQPLSEPYESWRFPFARDLVRPPYFQGKKYFLGYDKLVNPVEYGKFLKAIALFQKHERARVGGIYFLIKKERFEKMFMIIRNRRKGLPTELKTKDDFRYPVQFRDYSAVRRKTIRAMPTTARKANLALAALGLLPEPRKDKRICEMHRQYKSQLRTLAEHNMMSVIQAEVDGLQELSRRGDLNELDIVDEILEYFTTWHHASKPLAVKFGWDLLDLPSPDKKILPPPVFVAGIPKSLADDYVEKNFDKLAPALQKRPPYAGSALIVSGNHITKEKYMAIKPLALARQALPKEAKEAEAQKAKEQKAKEKEAANKKKGEDKGYSPQKSQIPLLALHRTKELIIANQYEEDEIHPLIVPKTINTQEIDWEVAANVHLKIREDVDKKMIAFQKQVRQQMVKKHRKAENLQKRKIPAMKNQKKQWALIEPEKWEVIYSLAKDGYFQNYRNYVMENMPGTNIFSFSNYEWIKEYLTEPEPAWGDLYQLVKLWCILPLADFNVRQHGPFVSAVAFVGPREVVNRLLCSVAHDTGSLLIRIDPLRDEGEIQFNKLANTIVKMAKTAQPTIVMVDNCHLMYPKRQKGVPPREKSPYLKVVQKIKKNVNKKFQILMIGITDKPETVHGKRFGKVFDKIIPFPYKDYHTAADYWGNYTFKNEAIAKNFPYPALVEPTKIYKTPMMTDLFRENVLTPSRKKELPVRGLEISEFFDPFKIAEKSAKTGDGIKMNVSPYVWAEGNYKSFKARKKMLKDLLDKRMGKDKDNKNKK